MADYQSLLIELLRADERRMQILQQVADLSLPECWVAAGFVRNLVWDHLHGISTSLNDVDVIYFDETQFDPQRDRMVELHLQSQMPEVSWSVKNQARMHLRNADAPYRDCLDAMAHWPEMQTAVAVRVSLDGVVEILSAFDLTLLFSGHISFNPKRGDLGLFYQRIEDKGWLRHWSKLVVDVSRLTFDDSDKS